MPRKKERERVTYGEGSVTFRRGMWYVRGPRPARAELGKFHDEDTARRFLAKLAEDRKLGKVGLVDSRSAPSIARLFEEWLEERKVTHSAYWDDSYTWKNHLEPVFGKMKLDEVTPALIRKQLILPKLKVASSTTVRKMVAVLSSFFSDQLEEGRTMLNPCRMLQKKTRKLLKPAHDPLTSPWIQNPDDIGRIHAALIESVALGFAVGALAGLRTSEIIALDWNQVDLKRRIITVDRQFSDSERVLKPTKGDEARPVPIQDALYPLLVKARERAKLASQAFFTKGVGKDGRPKLFACIGRVCPPFKVGRRAQLRETTDRYLQINTLNVHLTETMAYLQMTPMSWYQATRHTFASQWVTNGGSLVQLQKVMGHTDFKVTQRYAHLAKGVFSKEDHERVPVINFTSPFDEAPDAPRTCGICKVSRFSGAGGKGKQRPWVVISGRGYHASCIRKKGADQLNPGT